MKDKMMTSLMIGIVGALFLFVSVSNAYDYAGCKWPSNNMVYDAHSLSSGWQDVVSGGRVPWNNVTSSGIGIYRDDSSSNDVTLGYVQNGWLAVTSCSGSTIVRAPITFSTGYNWYTGTGTPTTNYYDARGVATHEFGHAIRIPPYSEYKLS